MGNSVIREPIQKRSIKKKEKIIKSGFELICEKGYYNTNTAEIAKAAGVSTGIIYQYFKDKHDILIEGIKLYENSIFYPILSLKKITDNIVINKDNFSLILKNIINEFLDKHKLSQTAHQEIMAMTHSDPEVAELYHKSEMEMTLELSNIFLKNGFNTQNINEKVHITIGMIDNLCHEIVYHKHSELNYDIMTDILINTIVDIFK